MTVDEAIVTFRQDAWLVLRAANKELDGALLDVYLTVMGAVSDRFYPERFSDCTKVALRYFNAMIAPVRKLR